MTKNFRIAPSHPSLPGHFPGKPIVPGVVLLGEILELIGQSLETSWRLSTIPSIKFHSPLRPNELVQLRYDHLPENNIAFSCQVGSRQIASGQFIVQTNDQTPHSKP